MPVTIESKSVLSQDELLGVRNVYKDVPEWSLPKHVTTSSFCEWLNVTFQKCDAIFYTAKFNGSVIGSAIVCDYGDETVFFERVCVNKITRGRGVGKRLVDVLSSVPLGAGRKINIVFPADHNC